MQYTAVIRTLGKGGRCYQKTLDSLRSQTLPPAAVFVYIAEGSPLPKETIGTERYVYVKRGMVAQRALAYEEVATEYCLFLDDDVYLPPHAVEILYNELTEQNAQIISPCVFANHQVPVKDKIRSGILGREVCRPWGQKWGYKVLWNAGFSYNNRPTRKTYESQTNAGPCFLCRKADFLQIHYEEERWLDRAYYAFPEDQVMFYKMYCRGLKLLTSFDSGIVHLDASSTVDDSAGKTMKVVYSEYCNKLIFWHRFILSPEKNPIVKAGMTMALAYTYGVQAAKYLLFYFMGRREMARAFKNGVRDGISYCRSDEYRRLPGIEKNR